MNGIYLWGTGHRGMAEGLDLSRLSDLPAPWPDELHLRDPWLEAALVPEGPESACRVSGKRAGAPVIFVAGACSSAMALAWHFFAMNCLPVGGSVICVSQWQGKGQLGRTWISPPGNLYAALRLPEAAPDFSGMMSLVTGYVIIRALQELGIPARLKWPNDIMVGERKAGGILIQNRPGVSVAGVGLNLVSAPPGESLRAAHAAAATHLGNAAPPFAPLSLWERLVYRGHELMDAVLGSDVPTAVARIQAEMTFLGREVRVDDHTGRPAYRATLTGLSPDGGLVLRTGSRIQTIRSGSITPLSKS